MSNNEQLFDIFVGKVELMKFLKEKLGLHERAIQK